jgi:hypothetical protein
MFWTNLDEFWNFLCTYVHGHRAAGVKMAARWGILRAGNFAFQYGALAFQVRFGDRDSRHERLCVGV